MLCSTCVLRRRGRLSRSSGKTHTAYSVLEPSTYVPLIGSPLDAFLEGLQSNYSMRLYGQAGLVPATLRLVWLALLDPPSRQWIKAIGVCHFSPMAPVMPFYAPLDLGAANPVDAIWVHNGALKPLANDSLVEITHCAQGWSRPLASHQFEALCHNSSRKRPLTPSQRRQCFVHVHRPWEPLLKNGLQWFYVAPGSGVSVNVGRTRAFDTHLEAEAFLRNSLAPQEASLVTGPAECHSAKVIPLSVASGLDSVQIVWHTEHFSSEQRHELIMLHRGECASLGSTPTVRCGRWPILHECEATAAAVRPLESCRFWDRALSKPNRGLLRPPARACGRTPSPCYKNDSTFMCTAATTNGWSAGHASRSRLISQ